MKTTNKTPQSSILNMNSGLNSICINFQTRPKINKHRAENIAKKGWEISSTSFQDGFLRNEKDNYKQAKCQKSRFDIDHWKERNTENLSKISFKRICHSIKRKSFSEKPNISNQFLPGDEESAVCPIFSFDNTIISHERLKKDALNRETCIATSVQIKEAFLQKVPQQSIDDTFLSNGLDQPKERKTENLSKVFSRRIYHSIKRKSVSEVPNITHDFLLGCEESAVCHISSFNDTFSSHKRLKKDLLRKETDIPTSLQIRKASLQQVSQQHIGDTLSVFQNVFYMNSKKNHDNVKENKQLNDIFSPESFAFENNSNKMPLIVSSNYSSSAKKDILFCDQENNDMIPSKLILKQVIKKDFCNKDNDFNGRIRAPFKISNHKIIPCESTSSYGTNWVQSLNWPAEEDSYHCEKKRIHKITTGGYAAHLLKLQRKELSEKNIYEHKIGTSKIIDSLRMFIMSVIYLDELVLAKCSTISEEEKEFGIKEINNENSLNIKNLEKVSIYFVIFQKKFFYKQQLKSGFFFILLKPWHHLQVNSLQYPVLFCTNFKNCVNGNQSNEKCQMSLNYESRENTNTTNRHLISNLNMKDECNKEDLFYLKWKKTINIVGRIQRIWKSCSLNKSSFDFSRIKKNWLYILLQSKQKIFYQLVIPFHFYGMFNDCLENIQNGEGRCFIFYNLRIAQRLQSQRYPKLFKYIQNLLKLNLESHLNQEFVYQLVVDDVSGLFCNETFALPNFPVYLQSCIKPLSSLQKGDSCFEHFSCLAKVLFQYKNYLYISDKSLSFHGPVQYVKVMSVKEESVVMSSEIIIKEAVIHEDYLILDQYSQIYLLRENQGELKTVGLKDLNIPLNINSKEADIVSVSGVITNVNENEACSWLQCNFCMSENLILDAEDIIQCEDCSRIVENPVLRLKMCVSVHIKEQPNLLLQIQLSPSTIKNILHLDDNSVRPLCNVSDVLRKKCGPFICFIRGVEIIANKRIFYLDEINTSEMLIPS